MMRKKSTENAFYRYKCSDIEKYIRGIYDFEVSILSTPINSQN